jgi:hypothetical protein
MKTPVFGSSALLHNFLRMNLVVMCSLPLRNQTYVRLVAKVVKGRLILLIWNLLEEMLWW